MSHHLGPLVAASATWLHRAYGSGDPSAVLVALAEVQVRQAAMVAAWLRYPTEMDAALVHLTGSGGTQRLDATVGPSTSTGEPWESWVDEVVVSWAACLLGDAALARDAARAASGTDHARGLTLRFRSLVEPDAHELRASVLLRHPGLTEPVARLHRAELHALLGPARPPR